MMLRSLAAALLAAILTACSQSSTNTTAQTTPAPSPTNAVDFPLYDGATILTARDWRETVSGSAAGNSKGVFDQGAGTYRGHEVIAETAATMPQLSTWLHVLETKPPVGYSVPATGSAVSDARSRLQALGVDLAAFERVQSGKRHGVVVLAVDPVVVDAKAGPMLGLIGKYKMLPQTFRDPIDAQAKERTGFTVSEALSPNTPIGAAIGALDTLRASGQRGLVLIDATKL